MKAEAQVTLVNPSGLHARPASIFVQTASHFSADIELMNLTTGSDWMPAKGILIVMMLGIEQNHRLTIRADGIDTRQAVDALVNLVQNELVYDEDPPVLELRGIPGSPGIAVDPAFIFTSCQPSFERGRANNPARDWQHLEQARAEASRQMEGLNARAQSEVAAGQADIFKTCAL